MHAALAIGVLQMLVKCKVCVYMHAALAIGALQILEFVVYAALTPGTLQVFFSDTFMFICVLLLPSGLCRCL